MTPDVASPNWPCDRLAARDPGAWRDAFGYLHPWMLELIEQLTVGRTDVVRDEVQVVIVRLLDRWPRVMELFTLPDNLAELPDRLRGFVGTIIRHDVISLLRRHRFTREHISLYDHEFGETGFDPIDYGDNDNDEYYDLIEMRAALGSLTDDEREVIRLFFWEDLTVEQVADQLKTSKTTAHRWMVHAINKLRRVLGVPLE